jgi:hypothetical protein
VKKKQNNLQLHQKLDAILAALQLHQKLDAILAALNHQVEECLECTNGIRECGYYDPEYRVCHFCEGSGIRIKKVSVD